MADLEKKGTVGGVTGVPNHSDQKVNVSWRRSSSPFFSVSFLLSLYFPFNFLLFIIHSSSDFPW
jgi:hypothetical protein